MTLFPSGIVTSNIADEVVDLDLMFVIPAYRHRGIAKQLTEWGLARADEIGLDTWANSNPITRDLFAQYGFECAREMSIDPLAPEDLSETDLVEWEMMRELVQPIPSASLWRPAGGEMGERSSPFAMRTICVFHSIQDDNSQVGNSHFAAEIDEQLKICRRARRLERLFFCKCM